MQSMDLAREHADSGPTLSSGAPQCRQARSRITSGPGGRIGQNDEDGDLTSYWEGAFDEHGNELHGGGIERLP